MSWHFYYQKTPESAWLIAGAESLGSVLATDPPFTTILQLDQVVQDDMTSEEFSAIKYRGPFYVDFDSDSIKEVIPKFKSFLKKLEELGVNLKQVNLYATGGKGFHITIPQKVFVAEPRRTGYVSLPLIYKEMAWSLFVDTLDLRVYSARKGRMFRTENVLRTNGKYKVQITVEEAKAMTPETYDEITSAKRDSWEIEAPELCTGLNAEWIQAMDKVRKSSKNKKSKKDEGLIKRFNGEVPPTLESICKGENILEGVGFQKIATQLAISFHALGKTENEMLDHCEGLCKNHKSDGWRYDTPAKRKRELSRMYNYMQDNPCYTFSAGGLISLLLDKSGAKDLEIGGSDPLGLTEDDEDLGLDDDIVKGIRINKEGIWSRTWSQESFDYVTKKVSELGIAEVSMLLSERDRTPLGFDFVAYVGGRRKGRRRITMNAFNSVSTLQTAIGAKDGVAVQVTEAQARGMLDIFRKYSEKSGQTVVALPREGVDLIRVIEDDLPDGDDVTKEVVYVSKGENGVLVNRESARYKFEGDRSSEGDFHSDLINAPKLEDTYETREFFDNLFKVNTAEVLSRTLGFYLAAFLNQILRDYYGKFPLLQLYGIAGSGKTTTAELLTGLHFFRVQRKVLAAGNLTPWAFQQMLGSSASIPVVLDEFKPSEMGQRKTNDYLMAIRNNYTGNSGGRGALSNSAGSSGVVISNSNNSAPLVFLGEYKESQTAILDRSILVAFNNKIEYGGGAGSGANERRSAYNHCKRNRLVLGQWGHLCVQTLLKMDLDGIYRSLDKYENDLSESLTRPGSARPIYNNAVVLTGLEFGFKVLETVFGDRYKPTLEEFQGEIINNIDRSMPVNLSEPSKVLSSLAHMSSIEDGNCKLDMGRDYGVWEDPKTEKLFVDIAVRDAWTKYAQYKRLQGESPLFSTEAAFLDAMSRHPYCVDTRTFNSPIRKGKLSAKIYRYDLEALYTKEFVEEFEGLTVDLFKKKD